MATLKEKVGTVDAEIATGAKLLNKLLDQLEGHVPDMKKAFKFVVVRLFEAVKKATPVDTGRAKQAWRLDFSETKDFISARIFNGVEYIIWLEVGSSKQAPNGMLRVNLQRFSHELFQTIVKITGRAPNVV